MRKSRLILLLVLGLGLVVFSVWAAIHFFRHPSLFDGDRAYQDVLAQMSFGPRIVGSAAHTREVEYIQAELKKAGWSSQVQQTTWQGFPIQNVLAVRSDKTPQLIIGAHYDSRSIADQDPPGEVVQPVPGANDGASGVAVLLELARSLPSHTVPVSLVFLDAEDDGGIDGRDWLMGSRAYVASLTFQPRAAIILDMIGDSDLNIYIETNSDEKLVSQIWAQAASLGYQKQFIPHQKYSMLDDHTPFLEAGIPAVDIIDFDYPYWHTSQDTADKVSATSLRIVGETVRAWLMAQH